MVSARTDNERGCSSMKDRQLLRRAAKAIDSLRYQTKMTDKQFEYYGQLAESLRKKAAEEDAEKAR